MNSMFYFAMAPLMKMWVSLGIHNILKNIQNESSKTHESSNQIDLNKIVIYLVFRLITNYYRSLKYWSFRNVDIDQSIFDFSAITPSSITEALCELAKGRDDLISNTNDAVKKCFNGPNTEGFAYVVSVLPSNLSIFSRGVLCMLTDKEGIPLDFNFISNPKPSFHEIKRMLERLQIRNKLKTIAVIVEGGLDELFYEKGFKPRYLSFTVFRSEFLDKCLKKYMTPEQEKPLTFELTPCEGRPKKEIKRTRERAETVIQKENSEIWIHSYPSGESKAYYDQVGSILNELKKFSVALKDIGEIVGKSEGKFKPELMTNGEILIQFLSLLIVGATKKFLSQQNIKLSSRQLIEIFHTIQIFPIFENSNPQIQFLFTRISDGLLKNSSVRDHPVDQEELLGEILKTLEISLYPGENIEELYDCIGANFPFTPNLMVKDKGFSYIFDLDTKKIEKC